MGQVGHTRTRFQFTFLFDFNLKETMKTEKNIRDFIPVLFASDLNTDIHAFYG